MQNVDLVVNVKFHNDGRCEGAVSCGMRMVTITPTAYGHNLKYEGFQEVRVPELDLPMDGPGSVGFVIGNIFGDLNPRWALDTLLRQMQGSVGFDTIGNA